MPGKNLTPEKREQRLNKAIEGFMNGVITREEYERAERAYAPNHLEAARALARTPSERHPEPRRATAKH